MDTTCLADDAIALRDCNGSFRDSGAASLVARKILVEQINGKNCDQLAPARDETPGYVMNCCDSPGRPLVE